MSFFDDNFVIEEGPFSQAEVTNISNEKNEADIAKIKELDDQTLTMDQRSVAMRIRELREADHKGDQEKLNSLIKDFKVIEKCLGNESKILLELQRDNLKKDNLDALNKAKLKNVEAKLSIIKYRSIIKEAARRPMRNDVNERGNIIKKQEERKINKKVLAGGVIGLAAAIAIGAGARSCRKNGTFAREETTTTNNTTTFMEETTVGETTVNETGYSVETVDANYTAPTRETTTETTVETNKDGSKKPTKTTKKTPTSTKPGTKIKRLRKRTKNGKVIVLKKATPIPTQKPVKPGSNTLPKPTKKTLSPEEKNADKVNKSEGKVLGLRLGQ